MKSGSALGVDLNGLVHLLEDFLGEQAVMADLFDLEETAVGLEADGPQRRQVAQALADAEVADGGKWTRCAALPLLAIWLDALAM